MGKTGFETIKSTSLACHLNPPEKDMLLLNKTQMVFILNSNSFIPLTIRVTVSNLRARSAL